MPIYRNYEVTAMVETIAKYWLVAATTVGNRPSYNSIGFNMIPPAMPTMPPSMPAKKQIITTL